MPITNKYSATCIDCGELVQPGHGLSEKKIKLNLTGSGWATRHKHCTFTENRRPKPAPKIIPFYDDYYDTLEESMTESDFFGGDIGDK